MKKIIKKISLLYLTSLILTACSNHQPTTFYLLSAVEPIEQAKEKNIAFLNTMTILVKPIKFPDYLHRPQMVLRENAYKLQLSEYHRWAEPLNDDFTRVFIENINTRIAPGSALPYAELNGMKPSYSLSIEVLQMDVSTKNQAVLKVRWALASKTKADIIEKGVNEYSVSVPNKSHESGVEAQSKAIALFSDQMATSIQSVYQNNTYLFETKE